MSTALTGALQVNSNASLVTGFGTLQPAIPVNQSYSQGTGNNQFDQVYFGDLSVVNSGTPKDLDLIGGGLTQPDGSAFAPVKIVEMIIVNKDATQTLTIGGGSNPWVSWLGGTTPTVVIPPSGHLSISAPLGGWAVTAGSADILRISTGAGTNVPFTIALKGRSA